MQYQGRSSAVTGEGSANAVRITPALRLLVQVRAHTDLYARVEPWRARCAEPIA